MIHHYMPARLTWMMIDSREFGGNSCSCGRHELLRLERGDSTMNDHDSRVGALEGEIAQLKFRKQRLESEHHSCSRGTWTNSTRSPVWGNGLRPSRRDRRQPRGTIGYFTDQ